MPAPITSNTLFYGDNLPPDYGTFKKAEKTKKPEGKQSELGI